MFKSFIFTLLRNSTHHSLFVCYVKILVKNLRKKTFIFMVRKKNQIHVQI